MLQRCVMNEYTQVTRPIQPRSRQTNMVSSSSLIHRNVQYVSYPYYIRSALFSQAVLVTVLSAIALANM